jgi:hypothetical protein
MQNSAQIPIYSANICKNNTYIYNRIAWDIMSEKYKVRVPHMQRKQTADKAVEGIMDVTKVATTGIVAVGVLGAVGAAFKK